jgi:hypothetical protein
VINPDLRVSPATREEVMQVVRSLEVEPQTAGRTNTIELVVPQSV